ncbi:Folic acid synthesis protein fol1 [Grifola frondosa]|uniref:2-amino-4-hydroxy-6-hydroxymethyldihydropteridine diphosphokinase n=1 Tax=Grifola frondosa TaxID=5627 RepID=A0A1C7MHL6_GRIFR|nr:Folic acid synthesis protein fol1 [Grifola frondosa]
MNFSQVSTPGDNTTTHSADLRDLIRVKNLSLTVSFTDGSRWPSNQPAVQPVVITLAIAHDLRQTAQTDDLSHSINYSGIVSSIRKAIDGTSFPSVEALADLVCESCLTLHSHIQDIFVRISRPKALLYACAAGIELSRHRIGKAPPEETFFIEGLECHAIVGVNPCEREERQRVRFNIWLTRGTSRKSPFDFRNLTRKIVDNIQVSTYLTLEALASSVARVVLLYTAADSDRVTVKAAKPNALILAESAEVEVIRTLKDYQPVPTDSDGSPSTTVSPASSPFPSSKDDTKPSGNSSEDRDTRTTEPAPSTLTALLATLPRNSKTDSPTSYPHKATIALGANIGDRFANIERALRLIESPGADLQQGNGVPKVVIVDTSFMYETSPMYITDQPKFINCACMVDTSLEPRELLTFLKDIENAVGRVSTFRNGPRAIDLDILTFDSAILDTRPESERGTLDNLAGQLVIPHPRIAERERNAETFKRVRGAKLSSALLI